jgi:8-oxo-dGTP pyrophosphatase MutT (NUDIX family)
MASDTPVVPKPAATVVVTREKNGRRQVFLTRRARSMRFLGGYYVFPGGRVDASDTNPRATDRIIGANPHDIEEIRQNGHEPLGFYTAAVRELFEEAGVLLLCDEAGRIVPEGVYREMRGLAGDNDAPFVDEMIRRGLYFAGGQLRFLQHFTTPSFSPMRFYTVFFAAELPEGQAAGVDNVEVERSLWIEPGEALEKNRAGEFLMIPPTMAALHMVMDPRRVPAGEKPG